MTKSLFFGFTFPGRGGRMVTTEPVFETTSDVKVAPFAFQYILPFSYRLVSREARLTPSLELRRDTVSFVRVLSRPVMVPRVWFPTTGAMSSRSMWSRRHTVSKGVTLAT